MCAKEGIKGGVHALTGAEGTSPKSQQRPRHCEKTENVHLDVVVLEAKRPLAF